MPQEGEVLHEEGPRGKGHGDTFHGHIDDLDDSVTALGDVDAVDRLQHASSKRACFKEKSSVRIRNVKFL